MVPEAPAPNKHCYTEAWQWWGAGLSGGRPLLVHTCEIVPFPKSPQGVLLISQVALSQWRICSQPQMETKAYGEEVFAQFPVHFQVLYWSPLAKMHANDRGQESKRWHLLTKEQRMWHSTSRSNMDSSQGEERSTTCLVFVCVYDVSCTWEGPLPPPPAGPITLNSQGLGMRNIANRKIVGREHKAEILPVCLHTPMKM